MYHQKILQQSQGFAFEFPTDSYHHQTMCLLPEDSEDSWFNGTMDQYMKDCEEQNLEKKMENVSSLGPFETLDKRK